MIPTNEKLKIIDSINTEPSSKIINDAVFYYKIVIEPEAHNKSFRHSYALDYLKLIRDNFDLPHLIPDYISEFMDTLDILVFPDKKEIKTTFVKKRKVLPKFEEGDNLSNSDSRRGAYPNSWVRTRTPFVPFGSNIFE